MGVCVYVCGYRYVSTNIYVYNMYMCMCVCICMGVYVYTNMYVYTCMCVCICMCIYTRYKIQDTRFFISGKLPIVHDYIQCLIKC